MCKERIEKAAKGVKGVLSAHWDKDTQMIHLQYDPKKTSPKAISKAIAKVGHDTDMDKADKAVYDKLPACCTIDKVIGHSGVCQKCEHGTQIMLIEQMTADL